MAEVTPIPEEYEPSLEVDALVSNVKGLFLKMLELSPYLPSELGNLVRELSDPRVLADITGGSLNISKTEKQELLETIGVAERLRRVLTHINRELEILELGKKIQSQVKSDMDKTQKDYYLREHIKALQKELGEGDDPTREVDELQFRLEEAELPAHAMKEAERELKRLKRTPPTRRITRSSAIFWNGSSTCPGANPPKTTWICTRPGRSWMRTTTTWKR